MYLSQLTRVASAEDVWSGAAVTPYPNLDDRFTAPGAGPALGAPGGFTYPIDGGCPDPLVKAASRFDALTTSTQPGYALYKGDAIGHVQSVAFYPNGQVVGITTNYESGRTAFLSGYRFSVS